MRLCKEEANIVAFLLGFWLQVQSRFLCVCLFCALFAHLLLCGNL